MGEGEYMATLPDPPHTSSPVIVAAIEVPGGDKEEHMQYSETDRLTRGDVAPLPAILRACKAVDTA